MPDPLIIIKIIISTWVVWKSGMERVGEATNQNRLPLELIIHANQSESQDGFEYPHPFNRKNVGRPCHCQDVGILALEHFLSDCLTKLQRTTHCLSEKRNLNNVDIGLFVSVCIEALLRKIFG